MPLNCSREPKHKSTSCDECGICCRCPSVSCTRSRLHPAPAHYTRVQQLAHQRKLDEMAAASAADRGGDRDAAVNTSLNEDDLATPIIQVLERAEQARLDSLPANLVEALVASMTNKFELLAEKQLHRVSPFSAEQLSTSQASLHHAKMILDAAVDAIVEGMSQDQGAQEILRGMLINRFVIDKSSENAASVVHLADAFIRSHTPMDERKTFATLAVSFEFERRAGLKEVVADALARALNNNEFMATVKPKVVHTTPPNKAQAEVDEDEDEVQAAEQEQPSTNAPALGKIRVTMSPKDVLTAKARWPHSRFRLKRAKADWSAIQGGRELVPHFQQCRIARNRITAAVEFVERMSAGWRAGHTRTVQIGDLTVENLPILNSFITKEQAFKAYLMSADERGLIDKSKLLGRYAFGLVFDALARKAETQACLSYFFTDGLHALHLLGEMTTRASVLWQQLHKPQQVATATELAELPFVLGDLLEAQKQALATFKYVLRCHLSCGVTECDLNPMHCCSMAVGIPCSKGNADAHTKLEDCSACLNFAQVAVLTKKYIVAVRNSLAREHEKASGYKEGATEAAKAVEELGSMSKVWGACGKDLHNFHAHVARGVWQALKMNEIVDNLKVGEAVLLLDHKMKVQPQSRAESTVDFYGKVGMSLLGAWLRFRLVPGGPIFTVFVDTVTMPAHQNAPQVQAVLSFLVEFFRAHLPGVTKFIVMSDNGSALSNQANLQYVFARNRDGWGVAPGSVAPQVTRWVNPEAQCGKTALDTHFSYVRQKINTYVIAEGQVALPSQLVAALAYKDGMHASAVALLEITRGAQNEDASEEEGSTTKVGRVRKSHDFQFTAGGLSAYDFVGSTKGSNVDLSNDKKPASLEYCVKSVFTSSSFLKIVGGQTEEGSPPPTASPAAAKPAATVAVTTPVHVQDAASPRVGEVLNTATPLQKRVAEVLVKRAVGKAVEDENCAIVGGSLLLKSDAVPGAPAKKKKKKDEFETLDLFLPTFYSYWAQQVNRPTYPIPTDVGAELHQMYLSGESKTKKWEPAEASKFLINRFPRNWTARLVVSEKGVKAVFTKLVAERKKLSQAAAAQQLSVEAAASGATTTTTTTAPQQLVPPRLDYVTIGAEDREDVFIDVVRQVEEVAME
jgi:hypothetical protein